MNPWVAQRPLLPREVKAMEEHLLYAQTLVCELAEKVRLYNTMKMHPEIEHDNEPTIEELIRLAKRVYRELLEI